MNEIYIKRLILGSGERYCVVINRKTGIPLFYPNLYITVEKRNQSFSVSTLECVAVTLSFFYRFISIKGINIEERMLKGHCLINHEIDALRDFMSYRKSTRDKIPVIKLTLYVRLSIIANYINWLADVLIQRPTEEFRSFINDNLRKIRQRRPRVMPRNPFININKSLDESVYLKLMSITDPLSKDNPFENYVRKRNQILILMLHDLGIRCGELLNLKVEDINFRANKVCIRRRADEKVDSRLYQPLVKTLGREIIMSEDLASKLYDYINHDRKIYAKFSESYLFISHKPGTRQGSALTISGYHKIINTLRACSEEFSKITGHYFRHTWNYNFSRMMDSLPIPISEAEQEQMREVNMGWKRGSGTSAIYNSRHIHSKAEKASMSLQDALIKKRSNK